MPSWSRPSRESAGPERERPAGEEQGSELELMRHRFVEALRRAEIVSLLSGATTESQLASMLAEELCEVYDAELGIVAELDDDSEGRLLGLVGASSSERGIVLGAAELGLAAGSSRAVTERGSNLLGIGGKTTALAGYRTDSGRRVVIGAARLYDQAFDEAEVALLEGVVFSAGQALERIWSKEERDELIAQLKASFIGTAEALANALEAKDDYTADHASEVASLAVSLGREVGLSEAELEDLRYGAIFHDIGKIAIPDAILNKAGPLTAEETEVMMTHPEIGARIVEPIPFLGDEVRRMVRHDHERWDGTGYPDRLRGEQIPLGARIILVVDSYHAMTSDRPYRRAMEKPEALAELARHTGTQFDPNLVASFVRIVGDIDQPGPRKR